jgi:hypothetical protein
MLIPGAPLKHSSGDGTYRKVLGGWRHADIEGEPLTRDKLSGALNKLSMYRGTSRRVDVEDYAIRRINGQRSKEVERAELARTSLRDSIPGLLKLLVDRDFETLVDLIFSTSGWRRLGSIGGPQKTLDLDVLLPSTGERALVQVKSKTTSRDLEDYIQRFDESGLFMRLFYVYHSGEAHTDDERVTVIGPEKLPELIEDAGLVGWLIRKVS